MFLKRIQNISNIGKFCDCKNVAGIEFCPFTIIFGNNGNGKSTFTSIFRSIQTGNNNILIARKTLGSGGSKKVHLDFEDNSSKIAAKFEVKKWNVPASDKIHIFDTKFIAENVYDGGSVEDDNRANFHRVVVGAEGKKLALVVTGLVVKIKECDQRKKDAAQLYAASGFQKFFSLSDFLKIPVNKDIDTSITEKEKELRFANQLSKPGDLEFKTPNLKTLQAVILKKVESSHKDAEARIKAHVREHVHNTFEAGESFLNIGKNFIKDGVCPFCGQDTSKVTALISAYQLYFDTAYNTLQSEISNMVRGFVGWSVGDTLKSLSDETEGWYKLLKDDVAYKNLSNCIAQTKLESLKASLQIEIEKKGKDFNHVVSKEKVDALVGAVDEIQTHTEAYNTAIKAFKLRAGSANIEDIRKDLERLGIIKARFDKKWVNFSEAYNTDIKSIESLKIDRAKAIEDLSAYSTKTFSDYQISINKVLDLIGADFKVKNLSERNDLRRSEAISCGFELEFFGKHIIEIDGGEDKPHFRNTLSEGDKSALAFSFFVATLSNNQNIKDALVVFDDPISSFDSERRKATARLLFSLKNKNNESPAQVIILTHESSFLKRLYKEAPSEVVYLQIIPDGIDNGIKKSTFARLDVYDAFLKPDAFTMLEKIKACVEQNNPMDRDAQQDCRIVLENALKAKYYLHLKSDIASLKSLGGYVETLVNANVMTKELGKEIVDLLPDVHAPHHSGSGEDRSTDSDGDVKQILKDTLRLLEKI